MPKLSNLNLDATRFKGKGFRPWTDHVDNFHTENENSTKTEQKTDHKQITNGSQTDHKTDHKQITNGSQIKETDHKQITDKITNGSQTDHKQITKAELSTIVGREKEMLFFMFNSCLKTRSESTELLTLQYISNSIKMPINSIKTTIRRLINKGMLNRKTGKTGRGGWMCFELTNAIYNQILRSQTDHKQITNGSQTDHKRITEQITNASSSGSYINTTSSKSTDVQKNSAELPPQWEEIVTLPLSEIGFTKTHLFQIVKQDKLSPQMVQDSIYAFAFDLTHNNKIASIKGSALNYFMGIVRNGLPYAFPENYKSPHEEGMRVYLERKKASESRQVELDNELINMAFKDWLTTLTDENINTIVPSAFRKMNNQSQAKQAALREYFKTEKWPTIKNELLCSENITADNPS